MSRSARLLALLGAFLLAPVAAQAERAADLVKAELIAEPAAIRAGEPFTVGVRLTMAPHWHTYWRNPGDSGLATEIAWTLPPNFSAGPIQWPAPQRIPVAHLVNYAYDGAATLLTAITPPADLAPGTRVPMKAQVSYLVCERECIPGEASLDLTLPVAASATPDPATHSAFAEARRRLPVPAPWSTKAGTAGEDLTLTLQAPGLAPEAIRNANFFPYGETVLTHAAPQPLSASAEGPTLRLKRSAEASGAPPARLDGVLTFDEVTADGTVARAYALGEEPAAPPVAANPIAVASRAAPDPGEATGLWQAALLALLGGLVLNLMPCVFPVLSIKVLSLVRQAGDARGRVRLHGLAYTAGVVGSFLALAAVLLALRAGGAEIGWGFQLQSPLVVAGLAYVLFAVALSLSGVVHVGGGIAGLGDGLTRRAGLEGSFFTGVLATVVATPCTAPFMGAAVGFAVTQSAPVALIVFAALGLGLALPFLALTVWPDAVRRLPRPGAWMETLKQALAFPVYATAAWLVWVLAQQVGPSGLLMAMMGLVLVGFSAWAYERARGARPLASRLGTALAALALLAAAGLATLAERDRPPEGARAADGAGGIQPFTQARLDGLLAQGRPVFVDMTAAWCLTCIVNERGALASDAVKAAFTKGNVAYLKGDWTNRNPEITALLERHGRSGVPLYVLYPPGGDATVLPQILTEATVVEAVARLAPPSDGRRAEATDPTRSTTVKE